MLLYRAYGPCGTSVGITRVQSNCPSSKHGPNHLDSDTEGLQLARGLEDDGAVFAASSDPRYLRRLMVRPHGLNTKISSMIG